MKNLLAAASLLLAFTQSALAWDQQENQYQIRIDASHRRAHVEANLWVEGNSLSMFNVYNAPGLKNGQADFIEKLDVRDAAGAKVAVQDKGEGDFELAGNRRLLVRYDIRLEHDRYHWPAGAEEVLYHTDEGMMAAAYYLFLAPGEKMLGTTRVKFDLPTGWVARTPWRATDNAHVFIAQTRRELLNNVLFVGTAQAEQFKAGGIDVQLVLGQRFWPQRAVMKELIERQMQSYLAMFGKGPQAERYLIIANYGATGDGGAFSGSFSQFLRNDLSPKTRPFWGRVMAHELLHFWNGLSLVPAEPEQEWFKEGVTDYLTVTSMAQNGFYDRAYLMRFLENLGRGQSVARQAQDLKVTVQQAAQDKHRGWLLVYGGGSIAGLALDVTLRQASNNQKGLPDLMRALYAQYGQPGKPFKFDDLLRVAKETAGQDVGPLLKQIVAQSNSFDLTPVFAQIGLDYEQHFQILEHHLTPNPQATPEARQRFERLFGLPLP